MVRVSVVADSVHKFNGKRITTLQCTYPRYIHAELMTHRVFSRNASSSRAIPVDKLVEMSLADMVEPIVWGKNQPGMQAQLAQLEGEDLQTAREVWRSAAVVCAQASQKLAELGLHKQWANRLTEWFGHISVVITSTEWDNFFELRRHEDAQPEIRALADAMWEAMEQSEPIPRSIVRDSLAMVAGDDEKDWHLPYILEEERASIEVETLLKMSVARCARVSYLKHNKEKPSMSEDLALFDRLVGSRPLHASPTEHQALAEYSVSKGDSYGNLKGWIQYRHFIELG